jgi:diguanylate cyclase (GGDEF)-like protein
VPARIGGEEFAVILPETTPFDVKAVAEKLRVAVSEIILKTEATAQRVPVTLSAGVACSQGYLVTSEHMLAAADAALYQSKGEGRNRTTMAPRVVGQTDLMKAVLDSERSTFNKPPDSAEESNSNAAKPQ